MSENHDPIIYPYFMIATEGIKPIQTLSQNTMPCHFGNIVIKHIFNNINNKVCFHKHLPLQYLNVSSNR